MEPAGDAEAALLRGDDFLDRMEAVAGLHGEEDELVPFWRDGFRRLCLRRALAHNRIKLERSAV